MRSVVYSRARQLGCGVLASFAFAALPLAAFEYPLQGDDQELVGEVYSVTASYEDTFAKLGGEHGFGYLEMIAANPSIDPWVPGEGAEIRMPGLHVVPSVPRTGIVINLPEYRLYYFPPEGGKVLTYPVGIGREGWSSPIGETRVLRKEANPSWYPPQSIREEHAAEGDILPAVVPPGPDNPMGPFKMNLAMSGYVIHGTNKKFGIGMRVSHGCFRMRNEDITQLFPQIPLNTPVRIVNQPFKLGLDGRGDLYLEVHTPLDEHGLPSTLDRQAAIQALLAQRTDVSGGVRLDWQAIRDAVFAEEGIPVRIGTAMGYQPEVEQVQNYW
ncbi:L,D-transpeptidase family protein [Halopseudomonas salina]|uniref:L,D-transpeptidase n=1 Tax=Halopseudomonas salina TaxID=1323744 RepID=A0ABQ1Q0W7_9GAMM|nr:L,D-transpeptidase family protein [Halopseudomonas salina]GGD09870.1 L,D-transpeptidase [Halopseudomonas salina]